MSRKIPLQTTHQAKAEICSTQEKKGRHRKTKETRTPSSTEQAKLRSYLLSNTASTLQCYSLLPLALTRNSIRINVKIQIILWNKSKLLVVFCSRIVISFSSIFFLLKSEDSKLVYRKICPGRRTPDHWQLTFVDLLVVSQTFNGEKLFLA